MKKYCKLFASLLFFLLCWIREKLAKIRGKKSVATCVVLYYHTVADEEREMFAHQMQDIVRFATPVAEISRDQPGHQVMVTFDDGFTNVSRNAVPILKKYQIPATFFIPVGHMGEKPSWSRYPREKQEVVVNKGELQELVQQAPDLFRIGSHTMTHPSLPELAEAKVLWEFAESKKQLATILKRNIDTLSLPYGEYDQKALEIAKQVGYKRVYSISPAVATSEDFLVGRVRVEPTDGILEFRLKLLGAYRWIALVKKLLRWK